MYCTYGIYMVIKKFGHMNWVKIVLLKHPVLALAILKLVCMFFVHAV